MSTCLLVHGAFQGGWVWRRVSLMLCGNIVGRTTTISLEIYNAVFTGEYDRAMVLVVLLGGLSCFILTFARCLASKP